MDSTRDEEPCSKDPGVDLISAVKELHALSSQELSKLIRDAENSIVQWTSPNGIFIKIDVEFLAKHLGLHLIATLIQSERNEELFKYSLAGFRLMHCLWDLTSRHCKLELLLLEDLSKVEQMLDLTSYMIIILGNFKQNDHASSQMILLHSALTACSLYLLTACITPSWHDLAEVLLVYSNVDILMALAFAAVRVDINFLQEELSAQYTDTGMRSSLAEVNHLCQHCEASLQFLQSLCQQKKFRECMIKNKDLSREGGVFLLAQDIMKLPLCKEPYLIAAVSRLKSKVLSILLHLSEVESPSFLDVVASAVGGLDLAKSTVSEVLELLKNIFRRDRKESAGISDKNYPRGLLQLNAMRLTEILSDDSNFRSYITINFTEALANIFSVPNGDFVSSWCSADLRASEEDATLDFDSLAAAGWVLGVVSSSEIPESTFNACPVPRASYAHQRTSLLVKIIANLSCFVPDMCEEEKDLFLNKFLQCLQKELPKLPDGISHNSGAERVAISSRNLRSLLVHSESLIPGFLNEDDVQLLRLFVRQFEPRITPLGLINQVKVAHNRDQSSSPVKLYPDICERSDNQNVGVSENLATEEAGLLVLKGNSVDQSKAVAGEEKTEVVKTVESEKDGRNVDTSGPDSGYMRLKKSLENTGGVPESEKDAHNVDTSGSDSGYMRLKKALEIIDNVEFPKSSEDIKEGVPEEEKVEGVANEEKQIKKRKRNIMNDTQIAMIEKALQEEPDMQRKAASIQLWADKLSLHGSEVTPSQVKNWLNNRKAKLARAAAKDVRAPSGGENASTDKQGGSGTDPESPPDEFCDTIPLLKEIGGIESSTGRSNQNTNAPAKMVKCEQGQYVVLIDGQGEEIGKGCIHQANGSWFGRNLDECGLCVVDVTYLKVDPRTKLSHPCDATGSSFSQAEQILGRKRVLWDSTKLLSVQQQQQQQQQQQPR